MPYAMKLDVVDSTTMYKGEAIPGASASDTVWRIAKIVTSGEDIVITWADGNTSFDNVWNNRASLTYS